MASRLNNMHWIILTLTILATTQASAEDVGTSYVDASKPFIAIKDVNRQSEAWAMCAATYRVIADILQKEQPARSRQLKNLANGADVAVIMSIVSDGLKPDISQEKFNALWAMAKEEGTELPKNSRTMLDAEAESNAGDKSGVFLKNLAATVKICTNNLDGQQMYIDSWHELAKSGLLTLPKQ